MPKLSFAVPKYRRHKASGQAIVSIDGRDRYLGPYGSVESREAYRREINALLARRGAKQASAASPLPRPEVGPLPVESHMTIAEVVDTFLQFADDHYRRPDGTPTGEANNFVDAARPLLQLYAHTPAAQFSPIALEAVRGAMIKLGWARTTVNRQVGRIRQMFRHAEKRQLVPPGVWSGLTSVDPLRPGRSRAIESEPVKPVPDEMVTATLPYLSPVVADMVRLQRLTGARPNEICGLRGKDITRAEGVWRTHLQQHKTAHHGHTRTIYFGPEAQAILTRYIGSDPQQPLFSPKLSAEQHRQLRHQNRRTPAGTGNERGTNRKSGRRKREPQDQFTPDSYREAIARACRQAFPPPEDLRRQKIPGARGSRWETTDEWKRRLGKRWEELEAWQMQHHWHPHQLRHTAATEWRRIHGADMALLLLGDRTPSMLERYAERSTQSIADVVAKAG